MERARMKNETEVCRQRLPRSDQVRSDGRATCRDARMSDNSGKSVPQPINATPCHCGHVTFCPLHGYTQEEFVWPTIVGFNKWGEPMWK